MKPYRFELYDRTNTAKLCELDAINASVIEVLASEHTLTFEIDPYSGDPDSLEQYVGTSEDSSLNIPLILPEMLVQITSSSTGVADIFIVRTAEKQRDGSNVIIRVECEHRKYALVNRIVRLSKSYSQINSTEFLNLIMPFASGFTITENDIPTTIYRDIEIDYPTVLSALKTVCDTWTQWDGAVERRFYYLCDKNGNIRIKREDAIGTVAAYPLLVDHNLSGIKKSSNDASLVNRLYHTGQNNTIAYADSTAYVNAVVSPVTIIYSLGNDVIDSMEFELSDVGLNANSAAWGSIILVKLNSIIGGVWPSATGTFMATVLVELLTSAGAVIGSSQVNLGEVSYPNRSVGNAKWFSFKVHDGSAIRRLRVTSVSVALSGGANPNAVGMRFEGYEYELAPNRDYVEDMTSQGQYGLVEARIENRDHQPVVNLIRDYKAVEGGALLLRDATLSGTYSSGLNECFVETSQMIPVTSGIATSENANRTYILNGTKSQRCVVIYDVKGGVRLATAPPRMAEGRTYQLIVNLYIVSGKINIEISQGYPWVLGGTMLFTHKTAGVGFTQVRSESGFGLPSGVGASQWDLCIYGDNAAEWYIDSFCVAQSEEPIAFYKANSANSLKDEATRILRINSQPRTQYDVDMKDLAAYDEYYADAIYNVGDDVVVMDNVANIQTTAKIYRAETDLFDPRRKRMTLADRSVGAAEMITLLTGAKSLRGGL